MRLRLWLLVHVGWRAVNPETAEVDAAWTAFTEAAALVADWANVANKAARVAAQASRYGVPQVHADRQLARAEMQLAQVTKRRDAARKRWRRLLDE